MRNRTTALRTTTATVPAIGHNNPPAPIGDPTTASVPTSPASPRPDHQGLEWRRSLYRRPGADGLPAFSLESRNQEIKMQANRMR